MKTIDNKGEIVIIRSRHLIYYPTSKTSLLSMYYLCEVGIVLMMYLHIIHTKMVIRILNPYFQNGIQIPLFLQATLLTFIAKFPTLQDHMRALLGKMKIVDIGIKNWDPC